MGAAAGGRARGHGSRAAHAVYLDDPATVWSAVRQFIRSQWPLGAEKVMSGQ